VLVAWSAVMFGNGESLLLPFPLRRRGRVPLSPLDFGWPLRVEAAGGEGEGGGGGSENAEGGGEGGGEGGESDVQKQYATAQRTERARFDRLGVSNAEEYDARIAALLETETTASRQSEPHRERNAEAASRTEDEWHPSQGRPQRPRANDKKYEKDRYGELTEKGKDDLEDDRDEYEDRRVEFKLWQRDQRAAEQALPQNLAKQVEQLPEHWREVPKEWEGKVPYAEVLADTLGGLAHAGLEEGVVIAAPQDLEAARGRFESLIRHIVAQETAKADAEAAAERGGAPPEGGRGTQAGGETGSKDIDLPGTDSSAIDRQGKRDDVIKEVVQRSSRRLSEAAGR